MLGKSYNELLELSRQCAHQEFGHDYIGTEHLLFALMRDTNGKATEICRRLGVDPAKICQELSMILPKLELPVKDGSRAVLTPNSRRIIDFAKGEAVRLGRAEVDSECLLIGCLRVEECVACQVLWNAGLSLESVRREAGNA